MSARRQDNPPTSPWEWASGDYQGKEIKITIVFDEGTGGITSVTVFRDPACVYTKLLVGKGVDGSPSSSSRTFSVPAGTTAVPLAAMVARGFDTISDFLALQITASQ